ncbi:hypothetical protein EC991_009909 [Linnemannia zychae]|nr:hypothetical protein EC991_009909 [Linnemannia zychae]
MEQHSALDRFKGIPELITLVAAYLEQADIISLQATSRRMHTIAHPFFYQQAPLTSRSPEYSLRQLARHANYLRTMTLDNASCAEYCNAMALVLKEPATRAALEQSTTTSSSSSHLFSQIAASISERTINKLCKNAAAFGAHFYYVIRFSPQLTSLSLDNLTIDTQVEFLFFARILSGIATLENLRIELYSREVSAEMFLLTIIRTCPPLVESLSLVTSSGYISDSDSSSPEDSQDKAPDIVEALDWLAKPIMDRRGALTRLKKLEFLDLDDFIDSTKYMSIVPFLPALEMLDIPPLDSGRTDVAQKIADCCPRLRELNKTDITFDRHGSMATVLLQALPEQTIESFYFLQLQEKKQTSLHAGLCCHTKSLRRVCFDECCVINMETVKAILFNCTQLEVFRITTDFKPHFKIPLTNVVKQPWASTNFTELRLVLALENCLTKRSHNFDPSNIPARSITGLTKLYRQLASLLELRILDLRVSDYEDYNSNIPKLLDYSLFSFPGMLTLPSRGRQRKGWLQLLGGLRKLEQLTGSFNVDAMLPGLEFGQREAEWIVCHWPKLKVIEFYTTWWEKSVPEMPPAVEYLQQKLVGLKVII